MTDMQLWQKLDDIEKKVDECKREAANKGHFLTNLLLLLFWLVGYLLISKFHLLP